ncbi:MAG: LysM peptidoglycan-binding domain-containing protein [Bacteroidales bacterium]|nr:LysM peptidoglycan-binding domain-containing protein [Bacteroidales bacterium]
MVLKKIQIALLSFLLFPCYLSAQEPIRPDSMLRFKQLIEDDQVVVMLDSLATLKIFEDTQFPNANQLQSWNAYADNDIPSFPDSIYIERIAQMNEQSPFEYIYNTDVKTFIELYGVRKRKLTARILGLSQIYFPLFEEQLDKFNMPLELKYLAVIESALNPVANSPAGAKGLWQFMYGTGKVYDLKVSTYVDDRFDPYKSTIAACEHLTDLYDIYGSWSLALAAYNSGAGNVNKAIRRAGGIKNFWAIKKYLPKETASYVPAFIAASYVITYANEHKIFPVDPGILYYEVDTVTVHNPLSFDQISEMLNIPMDEIIFLNPAYKHKVIPATAENPYKLRLRKKYVGSFMNNEYTLYAYKTKEGLAGEALAQLVSENYRESKLYTVRSGETVSSVAKKFHMSTSEVRSLNGLKNNYIKPNKKILVYTNPPKGKTQDGGIASSYVPEAASKEASASIARSGPNSDPGSSKPSTAQNQPDEIQQRIHVVRRGENLGLISRKYDCSVSDLMKWNRLKDPKIKVGQKLKVVSSNIASTSNVRAESNPRPKTTSANSQRFTYYTILSGDNLWDIANKFDVTVAQIKSLNSLKNHNRIKPGQKIKIPK